MYDYEITKVGIPIRNTDINESFLEVIHKLKTRDDCIGLMTADYLGVDHTSNPEYLSAPAGHELLFKEFEFKVFNGDLNYGVMNTFGKIWNINDGIQRDGFTIVSYLFNFLQQEYKKLRFKHVYMFAPGSPYVYDMFTENIRQKRALHVIDARSSIHTSTSYMCEYLNIGRFNIRDYVVDFIGDKNPKLTKGLNVFGGISNHYQHNTGIPMVNHFFQTLRPLLEDDDLFLYTNVGKDTVFLKCTTFIEALNNIEYFSNPDMILTYGVFKNDNRRSI